MIASDVVKKKKKKATNRFMNRQSWNNTSKISSTLKGIKKQRGNFFKDRLIPNKKEV